MLKRVKEEEQKIKWMRMMESEGQKASVNADAEEIQHGAAAGGPGRVIARHARANACGARSEMEK